MPKGLHRRSGSSGRYEIEVLLREPEGKEETNFLSRSPMLLARSLSYLS